MAPLRPLAANGGVKTQEGIGAGYGGVAAQGQQRPLGSQAAEIIGAAGPLAQDQVGGVNVVGGVNGLDAGGQVEPGQAGNVIRVNNLDMFNAVG